MTTTGHRDPTDGVERAVGRYRRLMWVYPGEFRRAYADQMAQSFRDLLAFAGHGAVAAQPTSIQYHLGGTCANRGGIYGPALPAVERAEWGVLYATPSPSRVVAIYEDRPLTEEEEKDW